MTAPVLAIPYMTKREHERLIAELPRICPVCNGEEGIQCDKCHGARIVGSFPRKFTGPVTFKQIYKAMFGDPQHVCGHVHRTAAAARRCHDSSSSR